MDVISLVLHACSIEASNADGDVNVDAPGVCWAGGMQRVPTLMITPNCVVDNVVFLLLASYPWEIAAMGEQFVRACRGCCCCWHFFFGELDNCFCARSIEVISNLFDRFLLQHDSFAGARPAPRCSFL